jgi:hypothetical protein
MFLILLLPCIEIVDLHSGLDKMVCFQTENTDVHVHQALSGVSYSSSVRIIEIVQWTVCFQELMAWYVVGKTLTIDDHWN